MYILVTGAAGFIGSFVCRALLDRGDYVLGVDNMDPYYDPSIKRDRLASLRAENFTFFDIDINNKEGISSLFHTYQIGKVINLAAQAGVRYSIENPRAYIDSNISGFLNILEACRHYKIKHLVFASSSSVYGLNSKTPYSVDDNVDHPVSLYAATKKANELMAHSYSHLYSIPCTGLRFFTVYGPWGRPDMAYFKFTKAILEGREIQIFNKGNMNRDFTYIDDIVEGVVRVLDKPATPDKKWNKFDPDPSKSESPYRLFNIGNNKSISLLEFVKAIEVSTGKSAKKVFLPMQPGDVKTTHANIDGLEDAVGYRPDTDIQVGIDTFVKWYKSYYLE